MGAAKGAKGWNPWLKRSVPEWDCNVKKYPLSNGWQVG